MDHEPEKLTLSPTSARSLVKGSTGVGGVGYRLQPPYQSNQALLLRRVSPIIQSPDYADET